jgi:hypothetical protein
LVDEQNGTINWNTFLSLYFSEFEGEKNYQQEIIARVIKANLKVADSLFEDHRASSCDSEINPQR